jgi:ubiquinone/menaquinone biosynthesis C-methylase UbiE
LGYFHIGPLRQWAQPAEKILTPYVRPGMTAIDIGCGMGHFSLPMARMVGAKGRVICVDIQQKMINSLRRRAKRAGLTVRLDLRVCGSDSLGIDDLAGGIDFIWVCYVAHEVPDIPGFFVQLHSALCAGGTLLLAEPAGHITPDEFAETVAAAEKAGLTIIERPEIKKSRAVLLQKN